MDILYKSHVCKVDSADKGKPVVALVSTEERDSQGDKIVQGPNEKGRGWVIEDYNKRGGRTYWMHNYFIPNLAKSRAFVADRGLMVEFTFDPSDELAMVLDRKIRTGYIDEWSIGAMPLVYETVEEGKRDIYETELWEVSVVNHGANVGTETVSKAMIDASEIVRVYNERLREIEATVMEMSKRLDSRTSERLINDLNSLRRHSTGV